MKIYDEVSICTPCNIELTDQNFKEGYICPFEDEPYCDDCFGSLEVMGDIANEGLIDDLRGMYEDEG